jgi:hypothetical protein
MSKRIIDIWWDVVIRAHYDSAEPGNRLNAPAYPGIWYKEKPLVRLRLVTDAAKTAYTDLSAAYTYSAAVDSDWNSATDPMCKTLDANINVTGDWESGGTADPALGQFSIRLDADNTEFRDKIGTDESIQISGMDLYAFEGTDRGFITSMPFYCFNVRDPGDAAPPAPTGDYYTKAEMDSLLSTKLNCEYFTADGQRKARLLTDEDPAETYETLTLPE